VPPWVSPLPGSGDADLASTWGRRAGETKEGMLLRDWCELALALSQGSRRAGAPAGPGPRGCPWHAAMALADMAWADMAPPMAPADVALADVAPCIAFADIAAGTALPGIPLASGVHGRGHGGPQRVPAPEKGVSVGATRGGGQQARPGETKEGPPRGRSLGWVALGEGRRGHQEVGRARRTHRTPPACPGGAPRPLPPSPCCTFPP